MRTIGQRYRPAMEIEDQSEADAYFEALVQEQMQWGKVGRARAEEVERSNLGYFAGYYTPEVRARVERLFHCAHPVFGSIAENGQPSAEEAFEAGLRLGRKSRT